MRQVIVRGGKPLVVEVPAPEALPGTVLVAVRASCISTGTEMAGMSRRSRSLVQRALANPDKVVKAVKGVARDGIGALWKKVQGPPPPADAAVGYSVAGEVVDVGPGVEGFRTGMRVAASGAGHANHAEWVAIPTNLAVAVPDGVDAAAASTVALGAIALQAVRRAAPAIGELVGIVGCGALGMLALQMLRASGCRVFVTDLDPRRLALATALGAEQAVNPATQDAVALAHQWTGGHGMDAVIVFAATASSEPLSQAFRMARRKGRVVLAGVAGSEYKREEMYGKELDFLISTSYGPGRYDPAYELDGRDYPYAYVRWTENRNMEAYLGLLDRRLVDVGPIIEVREPLASAERAYERLKSPERPLLAVLEATAGGPPPRARPVESRGAWQRPPAGRLGLALVGAGGFVRGTHLPHLLGMADRVAIPWSCSRSGVRANATAAAIPGCRGTTNYDEILADPGVHAVLIGTRHDSHADLAIRGLRAGKAVFVEKPMCLTVDEFEALAETIAQTEAPFMVGYNRRFSPFAGRIRGLFASRVQPLTMHYTMNAGYLPADHWTQGPEGGGRLMGEACHVIDLFRSLVGHPVASLSCTPLRSPNAAALPTDNFVLTLAYADGSVANLVYSAQGHRDAPKERLELFCDGTLVVLDDYLSMRGFGLPAADLALKDRDKGHAAEMDAFVAAVATGGPRFVIPWEELDETWSVSWQADRICRVGDG